MKLGEELTKVAHRANHNRAMAAAEQQAAARRWRDEFVKVHAPIYVAEFIAKARSAAERGEFRAEIAPMTDAEGHVVAALMKARDRLVEHGFRDVQIVRTPSSESMDECVRLTAHWDDRPW